MSRERAYKELVAMLGGQAGTLLCAILLDLPEQLPGADGLDAEGRSVILIGRHFLGTDDYAQQACTVILEHLKAGGYPDIVHPVVFGPQASRGIAAAVDDGPIEEVLLHGERGTGKSHSLAGAALINAEWHLRAGYPGPFKIAWLHDSLKSASAKTGEALELPLWGGLWSIKEDRTRAVFALGGKELVRGEFIGCADAMSAERLRQDAHMILAEELIASLTDGLGIQQQQWTLARSSAIRLETRRRSAMAATNPGSPDLWPAPYFGVVGPRHPTRLAVQVSCEDRMTAEQRAIHASTFSGDTAMDKRLGRGEWVMADLGQAVAEGFDEHIHVSRTRLMPSHGLLLGIGWDGGHSPSAVIGQNVTGQAQIFAALNDLHVGVLELIERQVRPWIQAHASWALAGYGAQLVHIIDPNMATPGQATITESAEKMIVKCLGGRIVKGPVRWAPRREAVLRVLAPRHEFGRAPFLIAPGSDTDLLVQAYSGRWYYGMANGQVDRTGPKKPNSPWADLGDASAYLLGWLVGGDSMDVQPREVKVETAFNIGGASGTGFY